MRVIQRGNTVIIYDAEHFDTKHIFECGQCFRWDRQEDGGYTGIAHDRVIHVKAENRTVFIQNSNLQDFNEIWRHYFDFDTDYSFIQTKFCEDQVLKKAMDFGYGMRILNQDLWECVLSFILSANNNIPRIKGIIKRFCEFFGDCVVFEGKVYYTFPKAKQLEHVTLNDLKPLKAGFRDKYLLDAISKVNSGEVALAELSQMSLADARCEIMKIKGIGPKVADCVLLFGAQKKACFPIDVWVRRVMGSLYHTEQKEKAIMDFVADKFGEYAGIAQQYLFYYMKEVGGENGEELKL